VSQLANETRIALKRIESVLEEFETLIKQQQSNDERLLNQTLSGVLDKLAVVDTLSEMVVELESRVYRDGNEEKN
jgi:cell division FtsZ-interacting protein ZapD